MRFDGRCWVGVDGCVLCVAECWLCVVSRFACALCVGVVDVWCYVLCLFVVRYSLCLVGRSLLCGCCSVLCGVLCLLMVGRCALRGVFVARSGLLLVAWLWICCRRCGASCVIVCCVLVSCLLLCVCVVDCDSVWLCDVFSQLIVGGFCCNTFIMFVTWL